MSKSKESVRVLIVGAGPAGLLAAQALTKQGYNCTVFEQDAHIGARARDWNFGIYWAQGPLQDCLPDKLIDRVINEAQVDSLGMSPDSKLPIYNSQTGELLKSIPIPNQIRVHRRNFLRLLSAGINIKYGKRIQQIESDGITVTVSFEDGSTETGSLLIGAEGAHSKVREFLLGKEKAALHKAPLMASFMIAKLSAEASILSQQAHPRFYAHCHPDDGTMWISCVHDAWKGTKPGDWHWTLIVSRPCEEDYDPSELQGPKILADLKQRAKGCSDNFRQIVESIPDDTKCWHNQLSYWKTQPWDNRNGTVTLIGDAAHPMTYHRGQGFNNAVLDVAKLAQEISKHGLLRGTESVNGSSNTEAPTSGVDMYEREMWPRGKEAVAASLENSIAVHDWASMMKSHLFVSGGKQVPQRDST